MAQEKLLFSVREIFSKCLYGCDGYNIPEYQRGYKWTSTNVTQLLDDLKNFQKSSIDDFYCLQNITIAERDIKGKKVLNVIDGQQRLTTLYIMLSYMNHINHVIDIPQNILKYSIREDTDRFIHEKIMNGEIWNDVIIPEDFPTKDQYYMAQVCKAIADWVSENELDETSILDNLKLIVNKVDEAKEEQVFANINGGKVDLDGADLIRAILITRAAKQKFRNEADKQKTKSFRVMLGMELDAMCQWWSRKDIMTFFEQLLPNRISQNNSFKYKSYPIDLLYLSFYEAYKDRFMLKGEKDIDIRIFENGLDLDGKPDNDHYEFYVTIMEFHKTMVDWFEDDEIFNLLGYLMSNFKSAQLTFANIWEQWQQSRTKNEFANKIKKKIKELLTTSFSPGHDNESWDNMADARFQEFLESIKDINTDWYNNELTKKLLPLADILPIEYNGKSRIRRADIQDFKCNDEDKEHLRSRTRNFEGQELTDEQKETLKKENQHGLNSIGNIVLLHKKVNRSYGNAKLYLKIDRILSEYALDCNAHIRPYTFDVFRSKLGSMSLNNGELFWNDEDIRETAEKLSSRINQYINVK